MAAPEGKTPALLFLEFLSHPGSVNRINELMTPEHHDAVALFNVMPPEAFEKTTFQRVWEDEHAEFEWIDMVWGFLKKLNLHSVDKTAAPDEKLHPSELWTRFLGHPQVRKHVFPSVPAWVTLGWKFVNAIRYRAEGSAKPYVFHDFMHPGLNISIRGLREKLERAGVMNFVLCSVSNFKSAHGRIMWRSNSGTRFYAQNVQDALTAYIKACPPKGMITGEVNDEWCKIYPEKGPRLFFLCCTEKEYNTALPILRAELPNSKDARR